MFRSHAVFIRRSDRPPNFLSPSILPGPSILPRASILPRPSTSEYSDRYTRIVPSGEWQVYVVNEVRDWIDSLDDTAYTRVVQAIDTLADVGPGLGRPLVDTIHGSSIANLKSYDQARYGSCSRSTPGATASCSLLATSPSARFRSRSPLRSTLANHGCGVRSRWERPCPCARLPRRGSVAHELFNRPGRFNGIFVLPDSDCSPACRGELGIGVAVAAGSRPDSPGLSPVA